MFEDYKIEIKKQYILALQNDEAGFFDNLTPAKCRDYCLELYDDEKLSKDDKSIICLFFKTNEEDLRLSIYNSKIDKFRPIISFLKGEKNSTNKVRINIAAILVDFQNRPYNKFSKSYIQEEASTSGQSEPTNEGTSTTKDPVFVALPIENKKNTLLKTNGIKIASGCVIIAMFFLGVHYFMKGEECMEWVNDHFEVVDCDVPNESGDRYISAKKEDLFIADFKKINPCDTLSFKDKNGNACLWYGKSNNGNMEFFNRLALHPETKKSLKEVSLHIFNTYIKGEPCE
jgi:hypothetical protein